MKFKALSLFFPMKEIINEELAYVNDCGASHHNTNDPKVSPDLRDKEGTWQLTRNGYPVTGRILEEQFHMGTQSPALPFYMALWAVVAMVSGILNSIGIPYIGPTLIAAYMIGFFLYFGWASALGVGFFVLAPGLAVYAAAPALQHIGLNLEFVGWIAGLVPVFLPLLYLFFKVKREAGRLAYEGAANNGAVLSAPRAIPNQARFKQDKNDIKDKSHLIIFGTATGRLARNGDELSPDAGLPFGLKTSDLSKHLFICGSTGSGKTTSGLRPVWMGFIEEERATGEKFGAFVGDGKAQLPNDFKAFLDIVVHPSTVKHFNVLEGIKPEVFARTLETINTDGKSGGSSQYFNSQARNLIYYGSLFHDAFADMEIEKNNLSTRLKILNQMLEQADDNGNTEIITKIQSHPDFAVEGSLINDAVNKFMAIQALANETKTSIFSTAESWIIPLMQSQALRPWADSVDSDFQFDQILYGKKYGFNLPEAEFGIAGVAITSLMKARLFQLITNRNNQRKKLGQSKVLLMIDEAQRVVDKGDMAMIAMAREWDLVFVYATQNIESLEEKFGPASTQVILDSFRNLIVFRANEKTLEYAIRRLGKAFVWAQEAKAPMIDFGLTSKLTLANPVLDPMNPYSGWMKYHSFSVFGWLTKAKREISAMNVTGTNGAYGGRGTLQVSREPEFIVRAADIQAINEPFVALAVIERAGVPRRDIVKTQPLDANFKPFTVDDEKAPEMVKLSKEAA